MSPETRRFLVLSNFFTQGHGGAPESVLLLARELAAVGIAVDVFCNKGLLKNAQALHELPAGDDSSSFLAIRPRVDAYDALFIADSWIRHAPFFAVRAALRGISVTYAAKGCLCRSEFERFRDVKRVPYFLLVEWVAFFLARRIIFSSRAEQRTFVLPAWMWRRRAVRLEEPFRGGALGSALPPDPVLTLGFLAEISPRKGLFELIDGLGHYLVLHKGTRVRLKIAGQPRRWAGNYRRACQELAEKNGAAPNIEWCGPVRGEARPAFYQSLDLFLCPSQFESFGLTPLEALWQGIPVCVAPDVGVLEYLPSDAPLIRLPSLRKEDIASAIASFVEVAGDWRDRSRPWRGRHALTRSNAEIACDFARVISDAKLA